MISKLKQHGYNMIPVNQDKTPAIKEWKKYQTEKYTGELNGRIGVICGQVSGGLEVLDFDNHDNSAKTRLWEYLDFDPVKEIIKKYELPIIRTQHGGYHIYYRCKNIEGGKKLAMKMLEGMPDVIIETRGEGNYVLAPPTPGYSLIKYTFENNPITPDERTILHEYAKSFNEIAEKQQKEYHPHFDTGARPGDVYNSLSGSINEVKELLRQHGWTDNGYYWTRPGKKKGISATFGKVADNVFYVFTSSAYPFENDKSYLPFSILALLKYNGDYVACARELAVNLGLERKTEETVKDKNSLETKDFYESLFNEKRIDLHKEYKEPPVFMSLKSSGYMNFVRIFTPGNISGITGKAKSKKTFFQTMMVTAATANNIFQQTIRADLPEDKRNIILFDTEQSVFDVWRVGHRIKRFIGYVPENLYIFSLRGLEADKLRGFLDFVIKKVQKVGIIFIDQIADLARSINEEEEAVSIIRSLERISSDYQLHICSIIHQNKADNFASGWLGSQVQKKAETVISVDKKDDRVSVVRATMTRNMEFDDIYFSINEHGLPYILGKDDIEQYNESEF